MGFIDLHHHVVFGVDDGPKTLDDSLALLEMAVQDGITHIVATSHAYPAMHAFPTRLYLANLKQLREACAQRGLPVTLYSGCEIFYSEIALRQLKEGFLPTLAQTDYVLVEFDPTIKLDALCLAVRQFANSGFRPVIAHCERYAALYRHLDVVEEMHYELRASFQINASTLVEKQPWRVRRFRDAMLKQGLVSFIATDSHNCTSRYPMLTQAYEWLERSFDADYAQKLLCGNQAKLLQSPRRR